MNRISPSATVDPGRATPFPGARSALVLLLLIIGLLNDYLHDLNRSFLLIGLTFLVSGVLWLWGARYLARDTELAPQRLNKPADCP